MDEDADPLPDHTSSNTGSGRQKMDLHCSQWKSEPSKATLPQKEGKGLSETRIQTFQRQKKQTPLIGADEKPMLAKTTFLRNKSRNQG